MPRFDETIRSAIEKAVLRDGSQLALCKKTGISTSIMSRYLKNDVTTINYGTWNMLLPAIQEFLPEEYHRTFMSWKTPEEWEKYRQQYPDGYREAERYNRELDIAELARTDPNFGKDEHKIRQKLNMINVIIDKLPLGRMETLNTIMQMLLADESKIELTKPTEEEPKP